ncbi:interferon lambda receptor 1 [Chaetodon auriga]|uniref:interferon lambda receptor 1 n=1 Tax=Chaetodon auriga TaxID=39042 RepID=UPI004032B5E7
MRMWSMRVIILLLFCYACLSTNNGNVKFVSKNFNNTLCWDPVEPAFAGGNSTYSVQYSSDAEGQLYQIKEGCQNITALSCDLTAETPSIYDVGYWAKVFVNGRIHGHTITRFMPIADTVFGPPILSIHTTATSLHVNVTLPSGPHGVSIANIISSSKKGPSKTAVVYTLKITDPKWATQVNETKTGQFVINLKNNRTEYCGYVVYKPNYKWGRSESENASFCVTLRGDPLMLLPWLVLSAALCAAIVIISAVCMCNYMKGGKEKSMPQQLVTTSSTPPRVLQSPDSNLIISKAVICPQSDKTVYATIRVKPDVPSVGVGGYFPQDMPCQAWQGSTGSSVGTGAHSLTPNLEDMSSQSSEIYSVVAVHVPAEERDFQQATIEDRETANQLSSTGESWDKGGMSPKLSSYSVPPLHVSDPCDNELVKPLLLHTVHDTNGQLLLPSLIFQLQSSTGDTQRKPLLSDLMDSKRDGPSLASLQSFDGSEWSDSGCDDSTLNTPTQPYCNTHYFPSQRAGPDIQQGCLNTQCSDALCESGYKQNWMPAMLLDTACKDSFEH